jgi:DNA primase
VLVNSRRAGYAEQELLDAGLAGRGRNGNLYDFFRRRLQFPLCDARGRVLGFGGRAVGADQKPKYVNSTDNAVYHKGRHLFGADLARSAAAKAGQVLLCEGYTDVIAMHQAGLVNTVGLMGTALTDDQVTELARLAPVVLLALDADSAGQEAMLKAARVAAGRRLELRVVPLPAGQDPADLLAAEGADGLRERAAASVPFVRFRVERELERGDLSEAEGKDAVVEALKPVLGPLAPSAMRDELIELSAGRLGVTGPKLLEWLAQPPRRAPEPRRPRPAPQPEAGPTPPPAPTRTIVDPVARVERAFLIQCLALPQEGMAVLARLDLEQDITTPVYRRVAALMREHAGEPLRADPQDEELTKAIAELQVRSAQAQPSRAALEAERLRLEIARIDREIAVAKHGGGADVVALVTRRNALRDAVEREVEATLEQSRHAE